MKNIKVGVIGVGYLGSQHARILSNLEGVSLAGVCDIDIQKGIEVSKKYNTEFYPDRKDLIKNIDAAVVATPTNTHFEIAKELLDMGKPTLVEKPITKDVEKGQKLIEISKKNKTFLQVGHLERFNPALQKAKEIIKDPKFIEVHRLGVFSLRSLDIDVILDLMIHDLDILLDIVKSEPKEIKAIGVNVLTDKIDIANARIEFESGAVANLTASRVYGRKVRKLRIFQPFNYISIDYKDQEVKVYTLKDSKITEENLTIQKEEPLKKELENFINSIEGSEKILVSGEDGLRALDLAQKIFNSCKKEYINY